MAGVSVFTDLRCWQRARVWSKRIFVSTKKNPFAADGRLVVQINDSSESVMSNIAEGFGRGTQGEFITFLGYAIVTPQDVTTNCCSLRHTSWDYSLP